jgi:hypothetical protein
MNLSNYPGGVLRTCQMEITNAALTKIKVKVPPFGQTARLLSALGRFTRPAPCWKKRNAKPKHKRSSPPLPKCPA